MSEVIAEFTDKRGDEIVIKKSGDRYDGVVNGICKQPNHDADGAIRWLAHMNHCEQPDDKQKLVNTIEMQERLLKSHRQTTADLTIRLLEKEAQSSAPVVDEDAQNAIRWLEAMSGHPVWKGPIGDSPKPREFIEVAALIRKLTQHPTKANKPEE